MGFPKINIPLITKPRSGRKAKPLFPGTHRILPVVYEDQEKKKSSYFPSNPSVKINEFPDNSDLVFNWKVAEAHQIWDRAMIVADLHIPLYDRMFCATVVPVAKNVGIKKLIIAGDLLDFDVFKSDKFPPVMKKVSFEDEISKAGEIIGHWFDYFDEIFYLCGNHDWRVSRLLKAEFRMEHLARLIHERLSSTNYRYIIVESGGRKWRITHPKAYRQKHLSVAQRLADLEHQDIWAAHSHFWGITTNESGHYYCVDGGGLFNDHYVEYRNAQGDTTHSKWKKGYGFIIEGIPTVVDPFTVNMFL